MTIGRHALGLSLLLAAGCATAPTLPGPAQFAPGQRPPPGSDEAGLWMAMDRVETNLKTSGRVATDPALTAYIHGVVCRVAGPTCGDIRVYVVVTPQVNASMAPNGAMQVWTGLLLRADNEAQLAYVLAHEVAHYRRRHTLQQWRDLRAKAGGLTVLRAVTGAAGVGFVGDLGALLTAASASAFSREQEREADAVAIESLRATGYDPREAPRFWEALRAEQAVSKTGRPSVFFATHPSTEDRVRALRELAEASRDGGAPGDVGAEAYRAVLSPMRAQLLRDELRRRDLAGSEVLLDRLLARGERRGELYFFKGEVYRLRAEEGDQARALTSYERAVELPDAPPEAYRALGLILMKQGDSGGARGALTRYLEARPDADDRAMVEAYLHELP